MFSKACEYGIRSVIYIASKSLEGKRTKIDEIVKYSGAPKAFAAKVLGKLTTFGIIQSVKGPYGGFEIENSKLKKIKISDIVEAIDGKDIFNTCVLGLKECNNANPCPIHNKFIRVRNEMKKTISCATMDELARKFRSGKVKLKG